VPGDRPVPLLPRRPPQKSGRRESGGWPGHLPVLRARRCRLRRLPWHRPRPVHGLRRRRQPCLPLVRPVRDCRARPVQGRRRHRERDRRRHRAARARRHGPSGDLRRTAAGSLARWLARGSGRWRSFTLDRFGKLPPEAAGVAGLDTVLRQPPEEVDRRITLEYLPLARVTTAGQPNWVYYVYPGHRTVQVWHLPSLGRTWLVASAAVAVAAAAFLLVKVI
jgi:hypothetical protein